MRRATSVSLVLLMAAIASPVTAQSRSGGWEFTVAPYLLGAGIDGSVTVAAFESNVDVPFDQIIEDLEMAFMGHFHMWNERWVISSDAIFVDLGNDVDVGQGSVAAGLQEALLEVAGGYRLSPAMALLVGARWVDLSTDLRYTGPIVDQRVTADKGWIDPIVGAQFLVPLSASWWLGVHGDIGGFGVGSDLAWQAYADIGWKASELLSIIVGYRAIDMDYEDGGGIDYFHYDLTIAGPQLGVAFTF